MIDVKIDKDHKIQHIECVGGPVELAAEVGLMMQAMYAEVGSINKWAAELLKKLLQVTMRDDSPAWIPPAGYTASERSAVITMPRLRRDDPSV